MDDPFFFQAEHGIRCGPVTGVQTCALPIYRRDQICQPSDHVGDRDDADRTAVGVDERSEERRVGKECRCRRTPYPAKKTAARAGASAVDSGTELALCNRK